MQQCCSSEEQSPVQLTGVSARQQPALALASVSLARPRLAKKQTPKNTVLKYLALAVTKSHFCINVS